MGSSSDPGLKAMTQDLEGKQLSMEPEQTGGKSSRVFSDAPRLHPSSSLRPKRHRSKHQHHRKRASLATKSSFGTGFASLKPADKPGHFSPVLNDDGVVSDDAENSGPKAAAIGTPVASPSVPARGPGTLATSVAVRSPAADDKTASVCSPPLCTPLSMADGQPHFRMRRLFDAGLEWHAVEACHARHSNADGLRRGPVPRLPPSRLPPLAAEGGNARRSYQFSPNSTRQLLVLVNTSLSRVSSAKTVSTGFYNLAKFYRSCERFVSAPAVSMSDVLRPVQKYGENVLCLSTFPDVVRYIVELSLAHGIHTVLDIRLSKFPDGVLPHISRGQTLSQKMDAQPALALEDYLKELLGDVTSMRDRELKLTDIFDSERRLSAIMASESLDERLSATVLAYLTKSVHQAEWLDALNAHLPDQYKLRRWSIISTDNVDLIRQLLSFFRGLSQPQRLGRRRVVLPAGDSTRNAQREERHRIPASSSAERGQCRPRGVRRSAKAITDGGTFAWLGELATKKAHVRLCDVSLHQFRVCYQDGTLDENDLEEASIASGFPGFFIRLKAEQQWSLLEDPPAVHEGETDDGFLLSNEILCEALSSSIVVPATLRQEPILYTGLVPPEFVMGSLGVLLARSLLYAAFHANATGSCSPEGSCSPALVQFEQCMDEKARAAYKVSLRERQGNEPSLQRCTSGPKVFAAHLTLSGPHTSSTYRPLIRARFIGLQLRRLSSGSSVFSPVAWKAAVST
ncbi:hypothetical protein HPB49_006262 [Dermacentor silvarum]|uniref:Uncharacterized protein n=1 Tax=Dermacentor silvarum TaxID=543639 RepID=A0ACB8DB69_DERSI|nr:hypothetical protein HPB49_006262 [Dermacentor silvarum]